MRNNCGHTPHKRGEFDNGMQYWGLVRGKYVWITPDDFIKRMLTLTKSRQKYLELKGDARRESNARYARQYRAKNTPDTNQILHYKKKVRYCNQRMIRFDTQYSDFGFSSSELKEHLSKNFTDGMTLANYGKWEIDHIIPLDTAFTEDAVKNLNRLDNLAPLWKKDNAAKRNRIVQY